MNIKTQTLNCNKCLQQHQIEINFDKLSKNQLAGEESILDNYICPNIATMYRVVSYGIDTRIGIFKNDLLEKDQNEIKNQLKREWGENNFELKFERYLKMDIVLFGIPDEYFSLLQEILTSYYCGHFYSAITSCGCLGERILNRLILKTRNYFQSSRHYKKIHKNNSFDNWDSIIPILKEWSIISEETVNEFNKLKKYRNDSVHYNDNYNFEGKSYEAINCLINIINNQFNYINRKDLFWVFDIPGEIWVKNEVVGFPFVKEFVIPNCCQLTPFDEPFSNPPKKANTYPLKPLKDEEFIRLRNEKSKI